MKNVVVLRVASAGLGNLLFQLSCAETIARKTGATLKLDLQGVSGEQLHSNRGCVQSKVLALAQMYGFHVEEATKSDIWKTRGGYQGQSKLTRYLSKVQMKIGLYRRSYFREIDPGRYDEFIETLKAPLYLDGYFINPRYFSPEVGHKEFIGDLSQYADLINHISNAKNSVSIHIRRGDYCYIDAYPVYGVDYVMKAVQQLEDRIGQGEYFIFTDDVAWVRKELQLSGRAIYIVSDLTKHAWEDLELMSKCHHNIISNSTFSWWASFRNENPKKITVMPKWWNKNPKSLPIDFLAFKNSIIIE